MVSAEHMKLAPFIATLGTMMTDAWSFAGDFPDQANLLQRHAGLRQIMMGALIGAIIPGFNIANAVLLLFGAAFIAAFILGKTILGRYTIAIGSNEEATRLSGVNVAAWKTAVYTLGGTFAGFAGVMIAWRP